MVTKPIQLVIADDSTIVRSSIRRLLSKQPDVQVIGEACNGAEALDLVVETKPDMLLLDIEMPVMDGIQVMARLKELRNPVKVLVMSIYRDRVLVRHMMAQGAIGYMAKDDIPYQLNEALHCITDGQQGWVSKKIALQGTNH